MLMCISSVEDEFLGGYAYILFRYREDGGVITVCHRASAAFDGYTDITPDVAPTYDHGKAQQEGLEEAGP